MLLKMLMIFLSLSLMGAKCAPKRPVIETCIINSQTFTLQCIDDYGNEREIIIHPDGNGYLSYSPNDWKALMQYIKDLEKIMNRGKKRLKKLKK